MKPIFNTSIINIIKSIIYLSKRNLLNILLHAKPVAWLTVAIMFQLEESWHPETVLKQCMVINVAPSNIGRNVKWENLIKAISEQLRANRLGSLHLLVTVITMTTSIHAKYWNHIQERTGQMLFSDTGSIILFLKSKQTLSQVCQP